MCFPTRRSSLIISHQGHRTAVNYGWEVPIAIWHLRLLVAASTVQRYLSLLS